MTLTLPPDLARSVRSTENASSTVSEAVTEYRARGLDRELAEAYREDAAEAGRLNREWEVADGKVLGRLSEGESRALDRALRIQLALD